MNLQQKKISTNKWNMTQETIIINNVSDNICNNHFSCCLNVYFFFLYKWLESIIQEKFYCRRRQKFFFFELFFFWICMYALILLLNRSTNPLKFLYVCVLLVWIINEWRIVCGFPYFYFTYFNFLCPFLHIHIPLNMTKKC